MRWQVTGVSSLTGVEQTAVVEADDSKGAAAMAKEKGILAMSAMPIGPSATVRAPPLIYASARSEVEPPPQPKAPLYTGLILASLLCIVVGGACVAASAYLLLDAAAETELRILAIPLVLCGILFYLAAFAGQALRDIARNSWRKP
jgi:hypothetical protein